MGEGEVSEQGGEVLAGALPRRENVGYDKIKIVL